MSDVKLARVLKLEIQAIKECTSPEAKIRILDQVVQDADKLADRVLDLEVLEEFEKFLEEEAA
jgi:hypothetical protein